MENKYIEVVKEYAEKNNVKFHFQWEVEWLQEQVKDLYETCGYDFEGATKQAFEDYEEIFIIGN